MLIRLLILVLAVTGLATLLVNVFHVPFGNIDFWKNHGVFFLVFITIFPRLTLLFSSVAFGGLLWWLGFFFTPRLLVAILATMAYWNTNPVLVAIAWGVAIGGESGEKLAIFRRPKMRFVWMNRHATRPQASNAVPKSPKSDDAIETEFKRID